MPTNANTFNSRVTSEALEAKFREVFPAQGGAELVQDLFASGVIQPVVDFSSVAEGTVLPQNLQTAWDFATDHNTVSNATVNLITTPGFWKVDLNLAAYSSASAVKADVFLTDGLTNKIVWELNLGTSYAGQALQNDQFVVFLRSGDTLAANTNSSNTILDIWYRQIADVNGTLVNPLGFTFS